MTYSSMLPISQTIQEFVQLAINKGWVNEIDRIYITNRLINLLKIDHYDELATPIQVTKSQFVDYIDQIMDYAIEKELIDENLQYEKDQLIADTMNLVTPLPSQINQKFWDDYDRSPEQATNNFYQLSQDNDYIKTRDIQKNIHYSISSSYGELEITINLSKPEKTPEEIKMASQVGESHYPKCALCLENEGFEGSITQAPRSQHRVVRLELEEMTYGFQYSPYVYYNEHSIFFSRLHRPMKIDKNCYHNLFQILDILPHYFVGSNADLPGVGGSILSHDHYQGGRYQFPMDRAKVYDVFDVPGYTQVTGELIQWPMSVIRLRSQNKDDLIELTDTIHQLWTQYSDIERGIQAYTEEIPHNTITPITRRRGEDYEIDIVLRNNRQSKEFPDGIFHPHPDVQHIKKENIGLIEVLGLAILPGRLVEELKDIELFLQDKQSIEHVASIHRIWAQELRQKITSTESIADQLKEEVGKKFIRVLEDAGVFKWTDDGRQGMAQFIKHIQQYGSRHH